MTPARDPKQIFFWKKGGRRRLEEAGGCIWHTSGRLLGDTWGLELPKSRCGGKSVQNHCVCFCRKWCARPFRVDGSDPTLTMSAACAQKLAVALPRRPTNGTTQSLRESARTPTDKSVWGILAIILVIRMIIQAIRMISPIILYHPSISRKPVVIK